MTEQNAIAALQHLLDEGWAYHDRESERLARELEAAAGAEVDAGLLAPFLHLAVHTIGEHLGDWPRALRLGSRVLHGRTADAQTAKAWARVQVAAVLAGDPIAAANWELAYLAAAGSAFGAALLDLRLLLVGALVGGKRVDEAARLYRAAVALIEPSGAPDWLERTVAAVSNNLGWELFEMTSRSPELDDVLRLSADTSLASWLKCGNWINEQRALYFRARVAHALGDPASALADADRGLAVIAANGPRPLDAALLHLARAAALDDASAKTRAVADADAAASKLTAPELQAQFAAQRAKLLA